MITFIMQDYPISIFFFLSNWFILWVQGKISLLLARDSNGISKLPPIQLIYLICYKISCTRGSSEIPLLSMQLLLALFPQSTPSWLNIKSYWWVAHAIILTASVRKFIFGTLDSIFNQTSCSGLETSALGLWTQRRVICSAHSTGQLPTVKTQHENLGGFYHPGCWNNGAGTYLPTSRVRDFSWTPLYNIINVRFKPDRTQESRQKYHMVLHAVRLYYQNSSMTLFIEMRDACGQAGALLRISL